MSEKNYEYIEYDPLFTYVMKTPLKDMSGAERVEYSLDTVDAIVSTFQGLLRPTAVEYVITDRATDDGAGPERVLRDETGLTAAEISDAIQDEMDGMTEPRWTVFKFIGSIRFILSNGIHSLSGREKPDIVKMLPEETDDVVAPIQIEIRQHDVMKPCETEIVTIQGISDHWLDGDERSYYDEATPLGEVNQARLGAAISQLYDAIEPAMFTLKTGESRDGWHVSADCVPGSRSLYLRHSIEWVLENFEQTQQGEDRLRLNYTGESVHPLIDYTQTSFDGRVRRFLNEALAPERFEVGATATVVYPDEQREFEKTPDGWRRTSE